MRVEKVAILNEVVDRVKASDYCFILNYGGVSVDKVAKLRAALKTHDSRLLVVKNTFLAKAAKEKGWSDDVQKMLTGPTAIVTGSGEVTAVAKDVMDFVEASEGRADGRGALQGARQGPAPRHVAHAPQGAGDASRARAFREGQERGRRSSRRVRGWRSRPRSLEF